MALSQQTATNTIAGERYDSVLTLPITDSTALTTGDFVELSSQKLIKSITNLSTSLVGISITTKTSGVASTQGFTDYMGVVVEGVVKVKGIVEGSGGTYTSAIGVGDKVSFYYSATAGYGQFVMNSTAAPIGTVVSGSVAASGSTTDQWDYILVQLDFEASATQVTVSDGAITTAKLGNASVTGTKFATGGISSSVYIADGIITNSQLANGTLVGTKFAANAINSSAYIATGVVAATKTAADVVAQINPTKGWMDSGSYAMTATQSTAVVTFNAAITSTAGVLLFCQALTATTPVPIPSGLTVTSFTITATNSATGNWLAWVPNSSK